MPRHSSPSLGIELRLCGPEPRDSALSGLLRRSMLRLGVAKLRLGVPVSPILVHLFLQFYNYPLD